LKRQRITIPYPIRTLQIPRRPARGADEGHEQARQILREDRIFGCLSDEQLESLVKEARLNHFGRDENVIKEGEEGDSMFILLRGSASVYASKNGASIQVASLSEGDCFGEMSLLTGERRTATVRANADCQVMEIFKPSMAAVLRDAPECVTQLSELLATRKMETEGLLKNFAQDSVESSTVSEYRATFLSRLRSVFEL
jgi:CRP-like cAMP-binding protein